MMKSLRHILLTAATLFAAISAMAMPAGFYAKRSLLADGNWVKVAVDQTGVYEISYESLRSMGFANPEKVAVYGRGGAVMPTDFLSLAGDPQITDDLQPVAILHLNNKIYFYGEGVDQHKFRISSSYACKGYYYRYSKSIYSNYGYYFLTDSLEPTLMEEQAAQDTSTLTQITACVGKYTHELDLVQNNSDTGQLFFGEKLAGDNARHEWKVQLPGAFSGRLGSMECYYYADRDITGKFSYGIVGSNNNASIDIKTYSSTNFRQQEPYIIETEITGPETTVFAEFNGPSNVEVSHIDYWTLTYQRRLPDLVNVDGTPMSQDIFALSGLSRNKSVALTFDNAGSMVLLDVTSPRNPSHINMTVSGSRGTAKYTNTTSLTPELLVFDPTRRQLQVRSIEGNMSAITNQDLHGKITEGPELVIICVPQLKEEAEQLADVHRELEHMNVLVATTGEVYNEFSQGIPDPMAYRSLLKAAYETGKLKNALFIGPMTADMRGIAIEKNPLANIIAYQHEVTNQIRGAQNANDYYGMLADRLEDKDLERNIMNIGIGILPARFGQEVITVARKVRDYIMRDDYAYYANRFTVIGGVGDNHAHDGQAVSIGTLINKLENRSSVITTIVCDAYGYEGAHDKLMACFDEGRLFFNYFGHGGPTTLNREGNFFRAHHVYSLRNGFLPFFGFAGCELTEPDKGVRGMGEAIVTSTRYGAIGTLLATRQTWSGQNLDLFQIFTGHLFRDGGQYSSNLYDRPLTIGEVYARTKNESQYNNELAYQLICDPAVKIPTVCRNIKLDKNSYYALPGEFIEVSGEVCTATGDLDTKFNGEMVMRLMEPFKELVSQDLISKDDPTYTIKQNVLYADTQSAMTVAQVQAGKFTARLFVPGYTTRFAGSIGRLHVCAYDPSTRVAAGSMYPLNYQEQTAESPEDADNIPPVIERFEYDDAAREFYLAARDNLALDLSQSLLKDGFSILIDGREYRAASDLTGTIADSGSYMERAIPVKDLTSGNHSALITVADAAGNQTTRELLFNFGTLSSRYVLELKQKVINGEGLFRAVGLTPDQADIIIISPDGYEIFRGDFNNGEFIWDATDSQGRPVAPGLYKAYILEKGNGSDNGHSEAIEVPVV